jgi:hypothetical protein
VSKNKKPYVHKVPDGKGRWKNVQDGKTISTQRLKERAIERGRQQAKNDSTEHRIHNMDRYGNDPNPPKNRK